MSESQTSPEPEPVEPRTTYIKFFAGVNPNTIRALMQAVESKRLEGTERFVILISSPGGDVHSGNSAYHFLKGLPEEVITHNYGSVDSIAGVIFCAGDKRYSSPHARFLIHGVNVNFFQNTSLEEQQLQEKMNSLKIDIENIAGIIASTTGKEESEILQSMKDRKTLSPEEAKDFGLITEIKEELIPENADLISIYDPQQPKR